MFLHVFKCVCAFLQINVFFGEWSCESVQICLCIQTICYCAYVFVTIQIFLSISVYMQENVFSCVLLCLSVYMNVQILYA